MLTVKIPVFNMLVWTLYCCLWEDKIDPCLQQPWTWLTMDKTDFMAPKIGYPTGTPIERATRNASIFILSRKMIVNFLTAAKLSPYQDLSRDNFYY